MEGWSKWRAGVSGGLKEVEGWSKWRAEGWGGLKEGSGGLE